MNFVNPLVGEYRSRWAGDGLDMTLLAFSWPADDAKDRSEREQLC
jgi:hypothetical protein